MSPRPQPVSLWFALVALSVGIFIVTVLSLLVTALVGNAETPIARFLDRHGGTLIAVEVMATLILGFVAMGADRRETLRRSRERREQATFSTLRQTGSDPSPGEPGDVQPE